MPVQEKFTRSQTDHVTRIIGSKLRAISPNTKQASIDRLRIHIAGKRPWNNESIRTIDDLVDYISLQADAIELPERQRYAQAIVKAKLPTDLVGEVYIRGWQGITKYDHRRGPLEAWLWGFVKVITREEGSRNCKFSQDGPDVDAFEDPSSVDPIDAISDDELEDEISKIRMTMDGFVRVDEMCRELTLLDLQKRAVRSVLGGLPEKDHTVVRAVLCEGKHRDTVARTVGFRNRDGVDQIIHRFQTKVRFLTDEMRGKCN